MSLSRILKVVSLVILITFLTKSAVFSEEEGKIIKGPPISQETAVNEPESKWLWGEVVSVDANNNQLTVRYLDYEEDLEKETVITVNEKTTYENAKSLSEIKSKDNVSIDYIVTPENTNLATNISLEKAEEMQKMQEGGSIEEEAVTLAAPASSTE